MIIIILEVETIITDQEKDMINCINKYFPKIQWISCLLHYKQDILWNLRLFGLFKKEYKDQSEKMINDLGKLPFKYKGDIDFMKN